MLSHIGFLSTLLLSINVLQLNAQTPVFHVTVDGGQATELIQGLTVTNNAVSFDEGCDPLSDSAFVFDGSTSYLTVPSHDTIKFDTSDFTVCVVAKYDTSFSGTQNARVFIQNGESGTNTPEMMLRYAQNSDILQLLTTDVNGSHPTSSYDVSAGNFTNGDWHAIAGVRTGGKLIIYMDGAKLGEKTTPPVDISSTSRVIIGAQNPYAAVPENNFYPGEIQNIKMFDVGLTEEQVNSECNCQLNVAPSSHTMAYNRAYLHSFIAEDELVVRTHFGQKVRILDVLGNEIVSSKSHLYQTSQSDFISMNPGIYIIESSGQVRKVASPKSLNGYRIIWE